MKKVPAKIKKNKTPGMLMAYPEPRSQAQDLKMLLKMQSKMPYRKNRWRLRMKLQYKMVILFSAILLFSVGITGYNTNNQLQKNH